MSNKIEFFQQNIELTQSKTYGFPHLKEGLQLILFEFDEGISKSVKNSRKIQSERTRKWILKNFQTDLTEKQIEFNAFGKPFISGARAFSISHTQGFSCILISNLEDVSVGVDFEPLNRAHNNWDRIAKKFFHHKEQVYCKSPEGFIQIWTRKEAILKALGVGLLDEMNQMDCSSNHFLWNNVAFKYWSKKNTSIYFSSFELMGLQFSVASSSDLSQLNYILYKRMNEVDDHHF